MKKTKKEGGIGRVAKEVVPFVLQSAPESESMQRASLEAHSSQLSRDGSLSASAAEFKLSVARMALKEGRCWTGVGE